MATFYFSAATCAKRGESIAESLSLFLSPRVAQIPWNSFLRRRDREGRTTIAVNVIGETDRLCLLMRSPQYFDAGEVHAREKDREREGGKERETDRRRDGVSARSERMGEPRRVAGRRTRRVE